MIRSYYRKPAKEVPGILSVRSKRRTKHKSTKATTFMTSVDILRHSFITWYERSPKGIYLTHSPESLKAPKPATDPFSNEALLQSISDYGYQIELVRLFSRNDDDELVDDVKGSMSRIWSRKDTQVFKVYSTGSLDIKKRKWTRLKYGLREYLILFAMRARYHIASIHDAQLLMTHGIISSVTIHMPFYKQCLADMMYKGLLKDRHLVLKFMKQVGRGLMDMHETFGVVHGDVKPENVMVHNGCAKWLDLAMAHVPGKTHEFSMGTIGWSAPEKCLKREDTMASDVWSWGIMVMDCLWQQSIVNDYYLDKLPDSVNKQDPVLILCIYAKLFGDPPAEFIARYMTKEEHKKFFLYKKMIGDPPPYEMEIENEDLEPILELLTEKVFQWMPEKRVSMRELMEDPLFNKILNFEDEEKIERRKRLNGWNFDWDIALLTDQPFKAETDRKDYEEWKGTKEWKRVWSKLKESVELDKMFTLSQRRKLNDEWYLDQTMFVYDRVSSAMNDLGATFHEVNLARYCFMFVLYLWYDFRPDQENTPESLLLRFESVVYHFIRLADNRVILF